MTPRPPLQNCAPGLHQRHAGRRRAAQQLLQGLRKFFVSRSRGRRGRLGGRLEGTLLGTPEANHHSTTIFLGGPHILKRVFLLWGGPAQVEQETGSLFSLEVGIQKVVGPVSKEIQIGRFPKNETHPHTLSLHWKLWTT